MGDWWLQCGRCGFVVRVALPLSGYRSPSPLLDTVREKFTNHERLVEDFAVAFRDYELADVVFIVGEDRIPLYGVKAILACRSR